jgi:hypothetical protein
MAVNRLRLLVGATIFGTVLAFLATTLVDAHSFRSGTNVTVAQGQRVDNSLFVAGRTVDINGEVFGDVFCAGQTVTVSGKVHGDVICAGQTVNITGIIDGDVRLAGQTVAVGAEISGNATIAGQTFNLESTGKIDGDVTVGSTDATLNGPVGRDLATGGGNVIIANEIGRDIKGTVNNLRLSSGAVVKGNIEFTSSNDIDRATGATVGGKITRNEPTKDDSTTSGAVFGFTAGWFIYWFFAMLLTAIAIALLFPRMLQVVSDKGMPRPWKALLVGFLTSILLPVVGIVLMITVIGIPLALILLLMWIVVVLLSGPVFGYYLGRLILRESKNPLVIMLLGASVLIVLYFIPIIGFIAFLAALWIGAGMLLLEAFKRTPKPVYDTAKPTKK